ncbi:MAG: threonylcarbamoyl-AMP synthase [Alphaproteobacteria bacterium]|nr:threonylcarbamoyl-AMP synthase [Alphaproteobacteria bacterium]
MDDLEKAIAILKSGGVIIYPTDTVYGIGCDATNPDAIRKLYALKNRSLDKTSSVCARIDKIKELVEITNSAKKKMGAFWPGNLTALLKAKKNHGLVDQAILDGKICVRIPNHPFVLALLDKIDFPLISTSANISGEPAPNRFDEIKIQADLMIEGDAFVKGTPSTIVDFTTEPFKVIRQGALQL